MTTTPTPKRVISDLALELVALGELDPASLGLAADDARVLELVRDAQATLEKLPPRVVAARVRERLSRAPAARAPSITWLAPLVTAAAVAFVVAFPPRAPEDDAAAARAAKDVDAAEARDDTTTVKGIAPALLIYALRDGRAEPLLGKARAGDVLQLATVAAGRAHGVVVSIDGRGAVTLHFPASARASTALGEAAGEAPLANSFELDDAPSFERFVLVTSERAIDVEAVLAAARSLAPSPAAQRRSAPLPLPRSLEQVSRTVDKIDEVTP